jgi:serpin B
MKFVPLLGFAAILAIPAWAQDADEPAPDPKEIFVPAKLDDSGKAVVGGLNRFGLDLYGKVRSESGDLAISPASISTAFGLAYAGAKGGTAAEIAAVLHYPQVDDFHGSFGALLKTMRLGQKGRTLSVNNALWLQHGLKVRPDYVSLVERHYGAGLQWVDYRADREGARQRINQWVEAKTNNRIRGLIQPANLKDDTRSILVNTVYFKADWAAPFDKRATKDGDFTLASGRKISRPLMQRKLEIGYAEGGGVKAITLPYRGGETEMAILLPDKADGLEQLEQSLAPEAVEQWLSKLDGSREDVLVTLPKFKLEARLELAETLQDLGMTIPFSNYSDFSGMKFVNARSNDREDWNFKIDDVVHKVFVEVEEKGTEAAAATAITQVIVTGVRIPKEPKVFKADHPFLFLIVDRGSGLILFIGRVVEPKS